MCIDGVAASVAEWTSHITAGVHLVGLIAWILGRWDWIDHWLCVKRNTTELTKTKVSNTNETQSNLRTGRVATPRDREWTRLLLLQCPLQTSPITPPPVPPPNRIHIPSVILPQWTRQTDTRVTRHTDQQMEGMFDDYRPLSLYRELRCLKTKSRLLKKLQH